MRGRGAVEARERVVVAVAGEVSRQAQRDEPVDVRPDDGGHGERVGLGEHARRRMHSRTRSTRKWKVDALSVVSWGASVE